MLVVLLFSTSDWNKDIMIRFCAPVILNLWNADSANRDHNTSGAKFFSQQVESGTSSEFLICRSE